MMAHQTAEKLRAMRLPAMAAEYIRQIETPVMNALGFDERFGMLADSEWTARNDARVRRLVADSRLREPAACFKNLDFRPTRKLDKAYVARLTDFAWMRQAKNLIITGCTGTGKTWMACAFGAEACYKGIRVAYYRVYRLLDELVGASGNGGLAKLLARLRKTELLILDDWGLRSLSPHEGRLLLEIFEDRFGSGSMIIAAQLPVSKWHGLFEDSTVADAVLDRVVHNSYRFELHGASLRRELNTAAADMVADAETESSPSGQVENETQP